MVTASATAELPSEALRYGLSDTDQETVLRAIEYARPVYADRLLGTGEPALEHALGMAGCIADLRLDADARAAAALFAVPAYQAEADRELQARFGASVARLVAGISRLNQLRIVTRTGVAGAKSGSRASQIEVLRKMLLAMVEDARVVLLRIASRAQTLRFLTRAADELRRPIAQETLDLYAPLANRLGVWQLKWELEDLSFRFIEPEFYKRIAVMLDERRAEREAFIARTIEELGGELAAAGVRADITGRPKHIFSIYQKMRAKGLDFSRVYDVRGLRVLVDELKDCYTALGLVHNLWQPIPREFDDYISRPKGNYYRSLHTAVIGPDGRALEVQIRTHEMHRYAELGVAAHWRYKEGARRTGAGDPFDEKIAVLRQMLAWRDDVVDSSDWVEQTKRAALDDTLYVLTPQGRVIDLPRGSTPVDFAYAVHTDLGHRCRGARVNGAIVPLDHKLINGERVEIIAAKSGAQSVGPSRDWLNPALGYIASSRARNKVRQWFNSLELEQTVASGRSIVERELQREGRTGIGFEQLASALGFAHAEDLFAAVGREAVGTRQLQVAIRAVARDHARARGREAGKDEAQGADLPPVSIEQAHAAPKTRAIAPEGILVVGVDRLLTQLARCCKPAPPDAIAGFVTRGRGVSVHRKGCASLARLTERYPERLLAAEWGAKLHAGQMFPVDIAVRADDRPGLARDISEVLAREHLNVANSQNYVRYGSATLFLTVEVASLEDLKRALAIMQAVPGVVSARRK